MHVSASFGLKFSESCRGGFAVLGFQTMDWTKLCEMLEFNPIVKLLPNFIPDRLTFSSREQFITTPNYTKIITIC